MAVGQNVLVGGHGYLAVGRETVLGTYTTCTSAADFLSFKMETTKDRKILEQVSLKRFQAKSIALGENTEGDTEFYFNPGQVADLYLLGNAFGGSVTTAQVTALTSFTHTFEVGFMNNTHTSLCFNVRYGDATAGKVFQYGGVRIKEFGFKAEMDDALKCTASFVAMNQTSAGTDVTSVLTMSATNPLSFVAGRFSVDGSPGSLTSTTFWHVQSIEYKHVNNLKSDNDCRRIGSDTLQTIAVGQASGEITAEIRFDTTTAYAAMLAGTQFAAEFEFTGETITSSSLTNMLTVDFPKVFIKSASQPEIGGPDEVLKSTVVFDVMRDDSSVGGYAVKAVVQNGLSAL